MTITAIRFGSQFNIPLPEDAGARARLDVQLKALAASHPKLYRIVEASTPPKAGSPEVMAIRTPSWGKPGGFLAQLFRGADRYLVRQLRRIHPEPKQVSILRRTGRSDYDGQPIVRKRYLA